MHKRPLIRIFAIVSAVALLLWTLSGSIVGQLTEWQLQRLSQQVFGQHLQYDQLERLGNQFTLHNPRFYNRETPDGTVRASADALELTLHFKPLRLLLQIDLALRRPRVQVATLGSTAPSIPWSLPKGSSLFSPLVVWKLSEGEIEWSQIDQKSCDSLSFEACGRQRGRGESELWWSMDQLAGHLLKVKRERRLDLQMERCDVASLLRQLHYFQPQFLKGWELLKGQAVGSLSLHFPLDQPLRWDGEVELDEWRLGHAALPSWQFEMERGTIGLKGDRLSGVADGALGCAGSQCPLKIEGEFSLAPVAALAVELTWLTPVAQSRLFWSIGEEGWSHIDLDLIRNGSDQARLFQALAAEWLPDCSQFHLVKGTVSAHMGMEWYRGELKEVEIDQLALEELSFITLDNTTSGTVQQATGSLSAAFSSRDLFKNLEGSLDLSGASLILDGQSCLEELSGVVRASDGGIDQLNLSGTYRGLHVACRLDPLTTRSQLLLSIETLGTNLSPWLPIPYQTPFLNQFRNDTVTIEASLAAGFDALRLEGSCVVRSSNRQGDERLSIGIDFEPVYSRAWTPKGWLSSLLLGLIDCRPNPTAMWERGRCTGLKLRQGCVHGMELPLDRYAPVLVLLDPDYKVSGLAEMKGEFDATALSVAYEARCVTFETSLFRLEVERIGDLASFERLPEESPIHRVDFTAGEQKGTIPIAGAFCWIRAGGLEFHEVAGLVHLYGPNVSVTDICADAEGVHFEGSLDLDRRQPTFSRLLLSSPTAYGPASAAQQVCSHYSRMALWELPLKGWIETRDEGLQLLFHFYPDDTDLELTATGWLRHGGWSSPNERLTLSDLDLAFDYDHTPHLLRLSAADGDLIQQIDGESLHYSLVTHEAVVSDLDRGYGTFDVELYQDGIQVARLAGSALPTSPDDPNGTLELSLDPSCSYLGRIHPKLHRCTMANWSSPLEVSGNLSCDLETLDADAALLHLLSIPFPTPRQIHSIMGSDSQGVLSGHFQLHEGAGVRPQKGMAGDLHNEVTQIGWIATSSGSKPLGEERNSRDDHRNWRAPPGLFEDVPKWRLALLGEGVTVRGHPLARFETRGGWSDQRWTIDQLQADSLSLSATLFEGDGEWNIERLSLEWNDLFRFDLTRQLLARWSKIDGITLDRGQGRLNGEIPISWREASLSPDGRKGEVEALSFSAAPRVIREIIGRWAGDAKWLSSLSPTGDFAGSALVQWEKEGPLRLEVELADDDYFIGGRWWSLKECQLVMDQETLSITAQTSLFDLPYWVCLTTSPTDPFQGRCLLSQWRELDRPHLAIDWICTGDEEVKFQKIVGSLQGVQFHLIGVDSREGKELLFRGQVGLDGRSPLIPPSIRQALGRLGVGTGYWLDGHFRLPKAGLEGLSFHGRLTGSEVELAGLRLRQLSSNLTCSPDEVVLSDLQIRDRAGWLSAERIALKGNASGDWSFSIPSAEVGDIAIGRLRTSRELPERLRSMTIPKAEVRQVSGLLPDKESWTGRGSLRFDTALSERPSSGLLAGSLTPAMGTIRYRLTDGRIVLTDFKDVYSHDRQSRFLLANRRERAYVDFDGNINIPLRMKQNRLLMKFTEMFLISLHGTVTKPEISLCDPSPDPRRHGATAEPDRRWQ